MTSKKSIIAVQPLDEVSPGILEAVAAGLQSIYELEATLLPGKPVPDKAYDPRRGQHNCYPILAFLNQIKPEHAVKIIGVTQVDLFIPILTHVFGEAELRGNATVISTFRLTGRRNPEQLPVDTLMERAAKIAVHEAAHTFGLPHCKEDGCIMGRLPVLKNIDAIPMRFCRYCQTFLGDEFKRLSLTWRGTEKNRHVLEP